MEEAEAAKTHPLTLLRAASGGVYCSLASLPGRRIVKFDGENDAVWQMLRAEMPATLHSDAIFRWRGRVDALALRARFSDPRAHASRRPQGRTAQRLFSLLEQNRVEALGARMFVGARANLAALAQEHWMSARPETVIRGHDAGWIETFALLTRVPLAAPLPPLVSESLAATWHTWMSPVEADAVTALAAVIDDQNAFATQALSIVDLFLRSARADAMERPAHGGAASKMAERDAARNDVSRDGPGREAVRPEEESIAASEDIASAAAPLAAYRVFTPTYDVSVDAGELYDARTLAGHRGELDRLMGNRLSGMTRWAHRLQRKLLTLQMRSWQFDREEGFLDAARLSRVATHPLEPVAFKQESEIEFPESVVTLLVDNSGSMRGLPIATAAVCAELLGRMLERCGVKSEILGFTTSTWRGGRAYRDWAAAGRSENPGRLAELRHVVYKSADQPWRRARACLGAMLADDLLKDNIDGEALLWAHERLMRRREPRKILLVISDGAPLDDVTLANNDAGYLERHLRKVIESIERRGMVELAAIGIGHDVRAFYRRAVMVRSAGELVEAIVTQLMDLFEPSGRRTRGFGKRGARTRGVRTRGASADRARVASR